MDADDNWHVGRVKTQVAALAPDVAAVFCDYLLKRSDKVMLHIPSAVHDPYVSVSLGRGIRTPHSGVLFSREAWKEAGSYRNCDLPAEDVGLWVRLAATGALTSVPITLVTHVHPRRSKSNELLAARRSKALVHVQKSDAFKKAVAVAMEGFNEYVKALDGMTFLPERVAMAYSDLFFATSLLNLPKPSLYVLARDSGYARFLESVVAGSVLASRAMTQKALVRFLV